MDKYTFSISHVYQVSIKLVEINVICKYLGGSNRSSENRLSDKINAPPQQSRPPGQ